MPAQPLTPGSVVDKLRIDRVLGHGAFAVTYLVTDPVLNKSFALKEYLPRDRVLRTADGRLEPADGQAASSFSAGLSRFIAEGRTVAQLDHPSIVKVFRCIEANATAYLLMPWYRGEALHKLLDRGGTLSPDETLALAKPLLRALDYLHGRGLFHRDIKPANVYITESGQPILLDFGAAGRQIEEAGPGGPALGSEGYAAPEQYSPRRELGPWTDIYGLAATLYRCCSGVIPVAAGDRRAAVEDGREDPLPPLERMLPGPEFKAIARAIDQGLRLEPARRPRTVGEWRPSFPPAAGKAAARPPDADIGQEGREWLPMILLGLFAVLLVAAVIYLFVPESGDLGPGDAATDPAAAEPDRRTDRGRHETPEERARWEAALESDTAYGYQTFLQDYPDSIHEDQARVHLERLDHRAWGRAQQENTRGAVEAYLDSFPDGLHAAQADVLLHEFDLAEAEEQRRQGEQARQELAAWERARSSRTIDALDEYLASWPGGLHGDEARALRRQLEAEIDERLAFEAAQKLHTIDAYRSYMGAFPRGRNVAEALTAIDALTLRPGKAFRDCPQCPSMMVVPAGSFWQGSDETNPLALKKETPKRMVTITQPFAISVFEITMAQWDLCVDEGGCSARPVDNGWGRGQRPVIMVSWNDTQEFTAWLSSKTGQSYRLPSESQWEYAARAGEESDWLGGRPVSLCQYANIAGSESGFRWQHEECADGAAIQTLPVGSLQANAFGLHDVIGNVAEWTMDCMNLSYLDAPADGSAWGRGICSSRMTRGGSWFTGTRDVRLPARFNLKNGDRNDFTGFRVVRTVPAQ
jgi:formylglycine-generating enzyme required for sulfatase activity/serine/threonine protein kinase